VKNRYCSKCGTELYSLINNTCNKCIQNYYEIYINPYRFSIIYEYNNIKRLKHPHTTKEKINIVRDGIWKLCQIFMIFKNINKNYKYAYFPYVNTDPKPGKSL